MRNPAFPTALFFLVLFSGYSCKKKEDVKPLPPCYPLGLLSNGIVLFKNSYDEQNHRMTYDEYDETKNKFTIHITYDYSGGRLSHSKYYKEDTLKYETDYFYSGNFINRIRMAT